MSERISADEAVPTEGGRGMSRYYQSGYWPRRQGLWWIASVPGDVDPHRRWPLPDRMVRALTLDGLADQVRRYFLEAFGLSSVAMSENFRNPDGSIRSRRFEWGEPWFDPAVTGGSSDEGDT